MQELQNVLILNDIVKQKSIIAVFILIDNVKRKSVQNVLILNNDEHKTRITF